MNEPDDRYLWDRTGPPDGEIVALERLLAPWRAAPDVALAPVAAPAAVDRGRGWAPFVAAAAAVVLLLGGVATRRAPPRIPLSDEAGAALVRGSWVTAGTTEREVVLGALGRVTVRPGARVQVREVGPDLARLFLARGAIEARISAAAKPRLFQVDTDAGRCVDLGCQYVLTATEDGGAHVRVTSGRVSFEADGREVFVPAGAEVAARRGAGAGTPRFTATAAPLAAALDAFDALPAHDARRADAARAAVARTTTTDDLLPLLHWLTDPDGTVARLALATLEARAGRPPGWTPPTARPGPADRAAFLAHLDDAW